MKAADVMVQEVCTAGPDDPVRAIAQAMLARRISGVPVVDGEGRVLGIVSEGDLIRRPEIGTDRARGGWLDIFLSDEERAHAFVRSHGLRAREVMTQPAICVAPATPLADVVRLMEAHGVKRLPVVEQGRLVGILTRADLVRVLATEPSGAAPARDDAELRSRIDEMLRAEDWAASAILNVEVEQGVVRLWGSVESAAQREALEVALRAIPGVKDIETHLVRSMPG
jgi:CBS domain-containing protein